MSRPALEAARWALIVIVVAAATSVGARDQVDGESLGLVLQRAGARVEQFFSRAASIVCLEIVRLQPLTSSWASDGFARTVESELRLSWEPSVDGRASTEAQTLRRLLKVNGQAPRHNDQKSCTGPEQQTREPQPLSLLLTTERADYEFALLEETQLDRRRTFVVDYRPRNALIVTSHMVDGRDDCLSFDVENGLRGRLWIDAETYDVLRLDQRLSRMVEIPLPKQAKRRVSDSDRWTMERWDTSIRFRRVTFQNPDEVIVLPASLSSVRITRGSGTPRLRTTTDYRNYQRFLTSGRVVGP